MRGIEAKDWRVAQVERGFATRSFYGTKGGSEHFIAVVVPSATDLRGQIELVAEPLPQV